MAVIIRSHINAQAGGNEKISLTTPVNGIGTVQITDVIGLTAALNAKLDDVVTQVGQSNVTATGEDLNNLTGTDAYGLDVTDFEKLADITVLASEINELDGIADNVQFQLDQKIGTSTLNSPQQIIIATGTPSTPSAQTLGDVLNGTVGTGYSINDLQLPTADVDLNSQNIVNLLDPIDAQDGATKGYVDTAVGGVGGPFLPLTGGELSGVLDMNGSNITLDAGGTSFLRNDTDNEMGLVLGGTEWLTVDGSEVNVHGQLITNLLDPVNPQDAVTKAYVDSSGVGHLPLAGGTMSGDIDMDGNNIIMDANGDSLLNFGTDNAFSIELGGNKEFVVDTLEINAHSKRITNVSNPIAPQDVLTLGSADTTYLQLAGGVMVGDINMGTNNITSAGAVSNASNQMDSLGIHSTLGGNSYRIDGTGATNATNPSYSFNSATDTGMFYDGTDLSFSHSGTSVIKITSNSLDLLGNTIGNILDPINPQEAATKNYVDTLVSGSAYLKLDGTDPMAGSLDMAGNSIKMNSITDDRLDFTGNILNVYSGGTPAFTVDTTIDVHGRKIEGVTNPTLADDAATKDYVDTTVSSAAYLPLTGGTLTGTLNMGINSITSTGNITNASTQIDATGIRSTLGGNGYLLNASSIATKIAPTYSFMDGIDAGMFYDGDHIKFSIGGLEQLDISKTAVQFKGNRIQEVADPVDDQDGVTLGFLKNFHTVRMLGEATGVNLMVGGSTPIYTVPLADTHVITQVIVSATSYGAGMTPSDAIVSVRIGGSLTGQIVNNKTLSWGTGGAANQVVYLTPEDGAGTPTSGAAVSVFVDTPAGGTYIALVVDVYLMGFKL